MPARASFRSHARQPATITAIFSAIGPCRLPNGSCPTRAQTALGSSYAGGRVKMTALGLDWCDNARGGLSSIAPHGGVTTASGRDRCHHRLDANDVNGAR